MDKKLAYKITELWYFVEEPSMFPEGGLTYEEVRDMLVLVREIKTKLEVLWAEKETERG